MAELSKDDSMSEVKELYAVLLKMAGGLSNSDKAVSANEAIKSGVSCALRVPMLDIMNATNAGLEPARQIAEKVTETIEAIERELSELPHGLGIDALLKQLSSAIQDIANLLSSAATNPTVLYPRLAFSNVPLNPAKLHNLKKQYKRLERSSEAVRNAFTARVMRGPPESSAQIISGINTNYKDMAGPLLSRLEKLQGLQARIDRARRSLRELQNTRAPFDEWILKQSELSEFAERIACLFDQQARSPTQQEQIKSAHSEVGGGDLLSLLEEGAQLVRSAAVFIAPLEDVIAQMSTSRGSFSKLAGELKDIFNTTQQHFSEIKEFEKTMLTTLPAIIDEIEHFFVPSGPLAVILKSSNETKVLLESFDKLAAALPAPQDLEHVITKKLLESECAQSAESVKNSIERVIFPATQLVDKLTLVSRDLPRKLTEAAIATTKVWISALSSSFARGISSEANLPSAEEAMSNVMTGVLHLIKGSPKPDISGTNLHLEGDVVPDVIAGISHDPYKESLKPKSDETIIHLMGMVLPDADATAETSRDGIKASSAPGQSEKEMPLLGEIIPNVISGASNETSNKSSEPDHGESTKAPLAANVTPDVKVGTSDGANMKEWIVPEDGRTMTPSADERILDVKVGASHDTMKESPVPEPRGTNMPLTGEVIPDVRAGTSHDSINKRPGPEHGETVTPLAEETISSIKVGTSHAADMEILGLEHAETKTPFPEEVIHDLKVRTSHDATKESLVPEHGETKMNLTEDIVPDVKVGTSHNSIEQNLNVDRQCEESKPTSPQ